MSPGIPPPFFVLPKGLFRNRRSLSTGGCCRGGVSFHGEPGNNGTFPCLQDRRLPAHGIDAGAFWKRWFSPIVTLLSGNLPFRADISFFSLTKLAKFSNRRELFYRNPGFRSRSLNASKSSPITMRPGPYFCPLPAHISRTPGRKTIGGSPLSPPFLPPSCPPCHWPNTGKR